MDKMKDVALLVGRIAGADVRDGWLGQDRRLRRHQGYMEAMGVPGLCCPGDPAGAGWRSAIVLALFYPQPLPCCWPVSP